MTLEVAILNALLANDEPTSVPVLARNIADLTGKEEPSHLDLVVVLRRLQDDKMVVGTKVPFVGIAWKETPKGRVSIPHQ